jgi:SAM-dependent methyltransferase
MSSGYKDKLYTRYVSTHNANLYDSETREHIRAQFPIWSSQYGKFLPKNKDAKIVDLGCASGGLVAWLTEHGYTNAKGVDISPEQIELGKKLGIESITCVGIMEFLKNNEGAFDLIFIRDTLGHFEKEEILDILDGIRTALAPKGKVVIKVPNAESPMTGRLRYGDFTHDTSFTAQTLQQLLAVNGFENIRTSSMRPVSHGIVSTIRLILWLCIEIILRFYRLVESGTSAGCFTQNILATGEKSE